MKFSFPFIKQFIPQLRSKAQAIETLTLYSFEAGDGGGETIEVKLPPNRYSDAASHFGIAKELAAKSDWTADSQMKKIQVADVGKFKTQKPAHIEVEVKEKMLCPRYEAAYLEGIKVGSSPDWMQNTLRECGLRPINNVVDVMNYVMLEVGQPLHAFDAAKVKNQHIVIRKAKRKEQITSIDDVRYELDSSMLLIADSSKPLAIAGIKGGRGSEVTEKTTRLIVESANFEPTSVYKTSKSLKLTTDASTRFSHTLSPALADLGLARALHLLEELAGAEVVECVDTLRKPLPRRIVKLDVNALNLLVGAEFSREEAAAYLRRLGFKQMRDNLWEVPAFRVDIETHEDLAEEIVRLFGFNKLKPKPPTVALCPSVTDDSIVFRDKVRLILAGLGVSEIYSNSFISDGEVSAFGWRESVVELSNPISGEFTHLRPSLTPLLLKASAKNLKFMSEVKLFEVGKTFERSKKRKIAERTAVGIVFASKQGERFFDLKAVATELLRGAGIVDYTLAEPAKSDWVRLFTKKFVVSETLLKIETSGKTIGYIGNVFHVEKDVWQSVCEINLEKLLSFAEGEEEYEPLPKFPAVMRDISMLVRANVRIGTVIAEIQLTNAKLIYDVDLIDEYVDRKKWQGRQSLTLRIVFQASDRTLTNEEVDKEMKKITSVLQKKFRAQIR